MVNGKVFERICYSSPDDCSSSEARYVAYSMAFVVIALSVEIYAMFVFIALDTCSTQVFARNTWV